MSTDTLQDLSLVTLAQNFRGDVVRQINRRSVLLSTLKIVPGEGKNVAWAPEKSGQLAEAYAEGADAENFGSDGQASALLSWGQYRANIHVSGLVLAASRSSGTPMGNIALWARNLVNSSSALASLINSELFSASGDIKGLDEAIDDGNTYATINRASGGNEYWRSYVIDPGSLTAPSYAQIRGDLAQVYRNSGYTPDMAVCSPEVFNKVAGLGDNTRRQVEQITTARGTIRTLDFGWQVIEVDGCMFVRDKDCTDNTIYYLNSDFVDIEYLAPDVPTLDPGAAAMAAMDGFGTMPLGFMYEPLAKAGDSKKAQVKTYLQLCVRRPNACGKRLNVLDV